MHKHARENARKSVHRAAARALRRADIRARYVASVRSNVAAVDADRRHGTLTLAVAIRRAVHHARATAAVSAAR